MNGFDEPDSLEHDEPLRSGEADGEASLRHGDGPDLAELALLLEHEEPCIFRLDRSGRLLDATPRAAACFGDPFASRPLGSAFAGLLAPSDRGRLQELLAARTTAVAEFETRERVPLRIKLQPHHGGWLGLVIEAGHSPASGRLHWLSQAVDQSPATVVITDAGGRIEYVNAKFCELTGYTFEEVRGRNPRILKSGVQSRDVYRDLWETVLAGGEWRGELHNLRKDGTPFWESATIRGLRDETGTIRHLMAVKEDITQRKLLEDRLQRSRDLLQHTLDGLDTPVLLLDADGNVELANEAASRETAFDPSRTALPDSLLAPELEEDGSSIGGQLALARREGRSYRREVEWPGDGGRERQLEIHGRPEADGGQIVWIQDLTERRDLERERLKSARLEAIGRLAGGIAHDFNNLLATVIGELELALSGLEERHPVHGRVQRACQSALRSRRLTQRLLTFASGGEPQRSSQALEPLLKSALQDVLGNRLPTVDIDLPPQPAWVSCDPEQLGQVVRELAQNAAQVGATKLHVSLDRRAASWSGGPGAGRWLRLRFSDDGPGLPEELLGRLFEPFTGRTAAGLGLAACWSIVRAHDGALQAESEPGQGAAFDLWLPEAEAVAATPAMDRPGGAARGRILVLEDEESLAETLLEVLAHLGHEAVWTRRGEDTIEAYRQATQEGRPFDLVLSDLTIVGGLGGEETMRRLRREFPDLRSIVSSGYSSNPVMARPAEYGFDAVVPKPWRLHELARTIERLLKGDA